MRGREISKKVCGGAAPLALGRDRRPLLAMPEQWRPYLVGGPVQVLAIIKKAAAIGGRSSPPPWPGCGLILQKCKGAGAELRPWRRSWAAGNVVKMSGFGDLGGLTFGGLSPIIRIIGTRTTGPTRGSRWQESSR